MTPNFAGWISFIGLAILFLAIAVIILKSHRRDLYDRLVGVFKRKPAEAPKEPSLPPIVDIHPPSPAPVAPITAVVPPSTAVAPRVAEPTAPSAVSGTRTQPERTAMSYRPQFPNSRAAPVPTAIQMLRNFKQVAALAQAFLDCPNELVKYCLYREEPTLRSIPRELLGVNAGWINACDYDGLLNNVGVHQCNVDSDAKSVSINGAPQIPVTATSPTQGWATGDGQPPDFYQPLARVNKSGADIVADFLRQSMSSSYLRGLGLTEEAIAAAVG